MTICLFTSLKDEIIRSASKSYLHYPKLPLFLKNVPEITQIFCQLNPWYLKDAPPKFKKDRGFVSELLMKQPWILPLIDEDLRKDPEFIASVMEGTRGLAYFLCLKPAADSPQVISAARSAGLLLNR